MKIVIWRLEDEMFNENKAELLSIQTIFARQ